MKQKQNEPVKLKMIKYNGQPINIFAHINSKQKHFGIYHTHSFHEFIFIAHGSVISQTVNKKIKMVKNDMFVLKPECPHRLILDNNNDYHLYDFEVDSDFLKKQFVHSNDIDFDKIISSPITKFHASNNDAFEIIKLFNMVQNVEDYETKEFYLNFILAKFITKLLIIPDNKIKSSGTPNYSTIYLMLQELNNIDNFTLNIRQIAEKLNYSHEYLIRLFKNANIESPNKIFLKNKLNYAATLLISSDMKIINIAELCGIYTVGYFNTAFKKEFNDTPSIYRKKHKQELIR